MIIRVTGTALMAALFVCAVCASAFSTDQGSSLARNWGRAYAAAKNAQIEHPDAGACPRPVKGLDGNAAQRAVEAYRACFTTEKKEATNLTWSVGSRQ